MKKLLTIIGLSAVLVSAYGAQIATNLATTAVGGNAFLLLTNRASIYSVELTATVPALIRIFDANSLAAPGYGTNWVNAAYTAVNTYSTNYVTSFIGQNGLTNWYTNAGVYTYTSTTAANTNQLTPSASFAIAAGTYAVYNTDALNTKGIVVHSSTNSSIVINYR